MNENEKMYLWNRISLVLDFQREQLENDELRIKMIAIEHDQNLYPDHLEKVNRTNRVAVCSEISHLRRRIIAHLAKFRVLVEHKSLSLSFNLLEIEYYQMKNELEHQLSKLYQLPC